MYINNLEYYFEKYLTLLCFQILRTPCIFLYIQLNMQKNIAQITVHKRRSIDSLIMSFIEKRKRIIRFIVPCYYSSKLGQVFICAFSVNEI